MTTICPNMGVMLLKLILGRLRNLMYASQPKIHSILFAVVDGETHSSEPVLPLWTASLF